MNISNVNVSDLASSIYRSGYSMRASAPTPEEFESEVEQIKTDIVCGNYDNSHIKRAIRLANVKGAGEDQFLSTIHVTFDLCASEKFWPQIQRYKFFDFSSSMSLMHRVTKINIGAMCNDKVSQTQIDYCEMLQKKYNEETDAARKNELYLDLLYNIPLGLEITAGVSTNYRCLKNQYRQRRNHRLKSEWGTYCDWIETLPLAGYLITGESLSQI